MPTAGLSQDASDQMYGQSKDKSQTSGDGKVKFNTKHWLHVPEKLKLNNSTWTKHP
jgi:hypothetical protein